MNFRLIITEKPSVGTAIAYCVGASDKVSAGSTFFRQGNGYIVANALGHLSFQIISGFSRLKDMTRR